MGLTERSFLERMELNGFTGSKIVTNYDLLISKNPEELARYYAKRIARCYGCEAMTEDDCFECQLEWLKSPADKEVDR